jgi:HEPN domain-containing protein
MPSRESDWLRQADADLRHARNAQEDGDFEWSCFAAHQAAEKAVKAVYQARHQDAWGHTVSILLGSLPATAADTALVEKAKVLDKHYVPTRYPNGFPSGAPTDFYTLTEAQEAIRIAEEIVEFCRRQI